ncbi:MAG: hypothetical protein ACM3ZF_16140 [Mycobacterium leprae]
MAFPRLGGETETEDSEAEEPEEVTSRGETEDESGGMGLELVSPASTFESIAGEELEGVLRQVSELGRLSEEMERVGRQFESAPATEADIANVFDLGKGIGRLGQGIGAALSVNPPSPAADVSVAVPEFNFLTRLSMPVPLLNAAANAKAVQWNGRHHPATSGVDPRNIRTDVARYVNLTVIAAAIQNFNAANPTKAIQLGTPPIDAVLVEGIHQFQAKCFFETGQIDGMAGESTLDSLGLVKRSGMNSVDQRNTGAHGRLGRVDVAALTSKEFTADTWFDHMVNPSFLGWRFLTGGTPRGVHLSFMRKLRIAERALLAQSKFSGETPVELGKALGFNATSEEHKGARPTATSASMHTYGLAVDIKYTGNPWVRGADFLAALKRSALLMSGVRITQTTSQRFLHDLGADATLTTASIFDLLAQRNRDFRDYLALSADPAGLTAALQRRRADGTPGVFATATESIVDAAQRWRTDVQNDLRNMRAKASPFRAGTTRDPLLGFLNLDRDLVIALRDTACLAWGAVDIGNGADGSGDMMHFDDRVCGIGKALAGVGGNFPPRSGHPCVAPGASAAAHEEVEAFEGGDFETERLEEVEGTEAETEGLEWNEDSGFTPGESAATIIPAAFVQAGAGGGGVGNAAAVSVEPFPTPAPPLSLIGNEAPVLDKKLNEAMMALKKDPDIRDACVWVIDLRARPTFDGIYQQYNGYDMLYVGSLQKISPMYAAFELRSRVSAHGVKAVAGGLTPDASGWEKIRADLKAAWQPKLDVAFQPPLPTGFPDLSSIFRLTASGEVNFAPDFRDSLEKMVADSDNRAASKCILALSYPYINGVLRGAGFFQATAAIPAVGRGPVSEGLWISGNYRYIAKNWIPDKTLDDANAGVMKTLRWQTPTRPTTNYAATAQQVARMYALLEKDRLVNQATHSTVPHPTFNQEIRNLLGLAEGRTSSIISRRLREVGRPFTAIYAKIGLNQGDDYANDGGIVVRTIAGSRVSYVVAALGFRNHRPLSRKLFTTIDEVFS